MSVPLGAIAGWAAKSPGLSVVTLKVTVWEASSAGPGEMLVAQAGMVCAPRSEMTVWFAPAVKVGASLTAVMVIVRVPDALLLAPPFAVPPSSRAVTVRVARPLASAAGV